MAKTVNVVEIFRASEEVPELVAHPLARDDVNAIWMQPEIRNDGAALKAEAAGLDVVQGRCMKVEYDQIVCNPMD